MSITNIENTKACTLRELSGDLVYNKTPEEEMEELRKVSVAESYLASLGIRVRTDMYGYYRNTYDILLDLGEYWCKHGISK